MARYYAQLVSKSEVITGFWPISAHFCSPIVHNIVPNITLASDVFDVFDTNCFWHVNQNPPKIELLILFCRSEEGYSSDDDSFDGLKENKLAQTLLSLEGTGSNPIAFYQSMWGMKDVQLKFTPEALEVIANQASRQNAGQDGIETILEKLFINLKFDMLGSDITAIEITEDVVLGKKRPKYIRKMPKSRASLEGHRKSAPPGFLTAIDEELMSETVNSSEPRHQSFSRFHHRRSLPTFGSCGKIRLPSRLTDYDMAILDSMEI